jgi:hypothetical protein
MYIAGGTGVQRSAIIFFLTVGLDESVKSFYDQAQGFLSGTLSPAYRRKGKDEK